MIIIIMMIIIIIMRKIMIIIITITIIIMIIIMMITIMMIMIKMTPNGVCTFTRTDFFQTQEQMRRCAVWRPPVRQVRMPCAMVR